jgi:hypothetical protein
MTLPRVLLAVSALAWALAAAPAVADWRSWLHGDPPAQPKAPPPQQLATVTSLATQDPQVEAFLRALAECVKARDGAPMRARLSDRYDVDGLDGRAKPADLFVQAVERIPGPTEIVIQAIEREANVVKVKTEFRYGSQSAKQKSFRLDGAGRLLWSDLFSFQVQSHGS